MHQIAEMYLLREFPMERAKGLVCLGEEIRKVLK